MCLLWLWIVLSGGVGSLLRHVLSTTMGSAKGTLIVNALGCLLFGFLYALFEKQCIAADFRVVVLTGFLGGFTTMSAFAGTVMLLFGQQRLCDGILYFIATNVSALCAVWIGFISAYAIFK